EGHEALSLVVDMHVVLVAEMLHPTHLAHETRGVRLCDLEMLGSHADRLRSTRRRRLGQKIRCDQIDLGGPEPGRDIDVVRALVDLARRADLYEGPLADDAD